MKNKTKEVPFEGEKKRIKKKTKMWKKILGIGVIFIIAILIISSIGDDGKEKEKVIEQLKTFTKVEEETEMYTFTYNGKDENETDRWSIRYSDANEAVRIQDEQILNFLVYLNENGYSVNFEEDASRIGYDLSEKEARIYCDIETVDGDASIINYNVEEDEFTIMVDGEHYYVADELQELIDNFGLADIILKDIETFENDLAENDMTTEEITNLKYKEVSEYLQ